MDSLRDKKQSNLHRRDTGELVTGIGIYDDDNYFLNEVSIWNSGMEKELKRCIEQAKKYLPRGHGLKFPPV